MKTMPPDWPMPKYWFGDRLCLTEQIADDLVIVERTGIVTGIKYNPTHGYTYSLEWDNFPSDTFTYAEHELITEGDLV
ncbi:hypothetical protein NG798_00520 [Ancylothrix sp. C2]|uniref:hypothetical protein n=1 Tax=Ancylothrix sp. D3o TaxID=2953691 RepID=UPI0021BA7461|nr:hypothetical protein [Ancylothrix sp. D3o]MCT7948276.1 hypothetical protein [Ancylothrix sp. D3o]